MTDQKHQRLEQDSMGSMQVPLGAYYGASTQRAVQNFPISNLKFPRSFIRAIGLIKMKSAQINAELGLLDTKIAASIIETAQDVADGILDEHFIVDIFQTGSGTSTNMNANEVIANGAAIALGGELGSRDLVHPNDHVNMGQSSNDVIPTAIHIAALTTINNSLIPALTHLQSELDRKTETFSSIVKTGRTHLQDATPIRLGQEFEGFSGQIARNIQRVKVDSKTLSEVALGGTAVGTGVNTHPDFASKVCAQLSETIGYEIKETNNHFQAQSALDTVVATSGSLKTLAVSLMKISNDLRWLGSGPRAGIGEISLPEVQPGSSIMPGKVNPVIPESVCQVCAQVIGNDTTITIAGQSGNFEINVMMPVAAYNLLESIEILTTSSRNLADQCISGVEATTTGPEMVHKGLAIVTTLVPHIGYDMAATIAKEAQQTGKTIREVAVEMTDIQEDVLDDILNPENMTDPDSAPNVPLG